MQIYTYKTGGTKSAKTLKRFLSITLSLLVLLQATPGAFAVKYVSASQDPNAINVCHQEGNHWGFLVTPDLSSHDKHIAHGDFDYNGPAVTDTKDHDQIAAADAWCENNVPQPPVDACPNETTDPGFQENGPCNSDDVCPNDPGIQTNESECTPPSCTDGIQNQDETGIDTGGVCTPPATCSDGIQNQDETGVDTGGVCSNPDPTCSDGIQNQDETGVDTGGVCTPPPPPSCTDGIQNQDETGVDTGGVCTPPAGPSADLGIDKSIDDQTPDEGQTVVYTLVVTNSGPDNATGVVVNDVLPAGLTYVSASSTVGSYNSGTGAWTIGNLNDGDSATLEITATVNSGTAGNHIINTGSVDGDQADSNSANYSDSSEAVVNTPDTPNDVCPNIDGVQTEVPSDKELKNGECVTPDNNSGDGGSHHRGGGGLIVVNQPQGQVLGATFDPGLPNTGTSPLSNSDTARNLMILFLGLATLIGLNLVSFNFVREE